VRKRFPDGISHTDPSLSRSRSAMQKAIDFYTKALRRRGSWGTTCRARAGAGTMSHRDATRSAIPSYMMGEQRCRIRRNSAARGAVTLGKLAHQSLTS
jgi:hypothetical protein